MAMAISLTSNLVLGANALLYSSFLGGHGIDEATSMILDPSGRVILSGYTLSHEFPSDQ